MRGLLSCIELGLNNDWSWMEIWF